MLTLSPGCRYFGGFMPRATPDGVPVAMMSPGSSVIPLEMYAMSSGTPVIICAQLASWRTSPFTRVRSRISATGGAAAASSRTGPSGANVSRALPRIHCGSVPCRSRAETSLMTV